MKKLIYVLGLSLVMFLGSCTLTKKSMQEPNYLVEYNKADFTYSDQVTGEASVTFFFGLDLEHLTARSIATTVTPGAYNFNIVGMMPGQNGRIAMVKSMALYDLMQKNPGYDVIFFPSYDVKYQNNIISQVVTVKVTARLGKLNK